MCTASEHSCHSFIIKSRVFNSNLFLVMILPGFTSVGHSSWTFSLPYCLESCIDFIFKQEAKQITRKQPPVNNAKENSNLHRKQNPDRELVNGQTHLLLPEAHIPTLLVKSGVTNPNP